MSGASVHGNLVLETVFIVQFPGGPNMLLDGLQHALDVLIMVLAEALELPGDERLFAYLHHFGALIGG